MQMEMELEINLTTSILKKMKVMIIP
jgi:hypothetical protein